MAEQQPLNTESPAVRAYLNHPVRDHPTDIGTTGMQTDPMRISVQYAVLIEKTDNGYSALLETDTL